MIYLKINIYSLNIHLTLIGAILIKLLLSNKSKIYQVIHLLESTEYYDAYN